MNNFDVAIVGGGPAGLSAALVLARACRRVAVIDAGTPRNSASPGVHAFLSRDGALPAELKRVSRKQIARYPGAEFIGRRVRQVRATGRGPEFRVTLSGADALTARTIVLAVGMLDELPDLPGFERHWGRRIIHCPFCHGFENRGRRWGILAKDLDDVNKAGDYRFWSDELTVFAERRIHIPDADLRRLADLGIAVDRRAIRGLLPADDGDLAGVAMDDGSRVDCDTIVYRPQQQQTAVVIDSGVALSEGGRVWIDRTHQTSIPGIFAAGDLTPGCQDALGAAAEGAAMAKSLLGTLSEPHSSLADLTEI